MSSPTPPPISARVPFRATPWTREKRSRSAPVLLQAYSCLMAYTAPPRVCDSSGVRVRSCSMFDIKEASRECRPPEEATEGGVLRGCLGELRCTRAGCAVPPPAAPVHRLPAELLLMCFSWAGDDPYVPAPRNQAILFSIQRVCRRWRQLVRSLLAKHVACTRLDHVYHLSRTLSVARPLSESAEPPWLRAHAIRALSVVIERELGNWGPDYDPIFVYMSEVAIATARILELCPNLVDLEIGRRKNPDSCYLGKLWIPPLVEALKQKDLQSFSLVSTKEDESVAGTLDLPIVTELLSGWRHLTHLTLDGLFESSGQFDSIVAAPPPPCRLQYLGLGTWSDTYENWTLLDWILSNSRGGLLEFRCREAFFASAPRSSPSSTSRADSAYTDRPLGGLRAVLAQHGRSLQRLDFGLLLCTDDELDFEDFASLLSLCPNLISYTHGDIVLDPPAVDWLAASDLRELRIYFQAANGCAAQFAECLEPEPPLPLSPPPPSSSSRSQAYLEKGRFAQLRAFHVVMDEERWVHDPPEPQRLAAVEEVCRRRGIEFMRCLTRRFKGG